MKAVLCPVCSGKGKVVNDNCSTSQGSYQETCHGCWGKGWVEVCEDNFYLGSVSTYLMFNKKKE
jgi:hypothetical protein